MNTTVNTIKFFKEPIVVKGECYLCSEAILNETYYAMETTSGLWKPIK